MVDLTNDKVRKELEEALEEAFDQVLSKGKTYEVKYAPLSELVSRCPGNYKESDGYDGEK